jgi:CBS domain containing-hemolysin-like protein
MSTFYFWLVAVSLVLGTLSSIACCVMKEIAWHELEEYCLQKQQPDVFGRIFNHRYSMEVGANVLQMMCLAVLVCSTTGWLHGSTALEEASVKQFLFIAGVIGLALVVTQSWIPWAISKIASPQFLFRTYRWWRLVAVAGFPFLAGEKFVSTLFARASGQSEKKNEEEEEEAFEDEILSLASEAQHDGHLQRDKRDMIEGVMDLDDANVTKIMTPRSRVDALEVNTKWEAMLEFVVTSGRTRIPVYDGKSDNIVGVLFAKDLLRESLKKKGKRRPLKKLLRDPLLVNDSMRLDTMLATFLQGRMHMAVVRDEHKGFAGVVTIEDVLEEIVGEIVDETDDEEREQILMLAPRVAEVDGATPIDRVNEKLGVLLPEDEDFATVSGLIMRELKDIPRPGHEFMILNVKVEIKEANRRSIRAVRLEVVDSPESTEG